MGWVRIWTDYDDTTYSICRAYDDTDGIKELSDSLIDSLERAIEIYYQAQQIIESLDSKNRVISESDLTEEIEGLKQLLGDRYSPSHSP